MIRSRYLRFARLTRWLPSCSSRAQQFSGLWVKRTWNSIYRTLFHVRNHLGELDVEVGVVVDDFTLNLLLPVDVGRPAFQGELTPGMVIDADSVQSLYARSPITRMSWSVRVTSPPTLLIRLPPKTFRRCPSPLRVHRSDAWSSRPPHATRCPPWNWHRPSPSHTVHHRTGRMRLGRRRLWNLID